KDAIVIRDGQQVTEFRDGMLPWALQHNVALCFDEYDAGRPDVMFVIQRVLEVSGKLTLLDQNKVIRPHPAFRFFSTATTTGLYHGQQQINQGQMDAGRSSPRSIICRTTTRSTSCWRRRRPIARRRGATPSTRWCASPI